jgi:hypothetical protein
MKNKKTIKNTSKSKSIIYFKLIKKIAADTLWKKRSRFGRFAVIALAILFFITSVAYGIAQYYIQKHADEPLKIGATFIPNYAEYFELDPKETMQAMIDDLGIKRFRLVTYWKDYEPSPDQYNFEKLDWQFDMVEEAGGEIALALGLRQPRWPECHGPEWAMQKTVPEWTEDLKEFMGVVIDRYKDREVLLEYQLENEYFLSVFGECPDFSRERLVDEFNYIKQKDPSRQVMVSRSNNATPSWPIGEPRADIVGASIYKRVFDKTITKKYFEYPYPAWFYAFLAGATEITTNRNSMIHELQTESWLPEGYSMKTAPIPELYKTFNPERVEARIAYGVDTGIKTIDLWGVEWWYHMKTKRDAPEIWNTAKIELEKYR